MVRYKDRLYSENVTFAKLYGNGNTYKIKLVCMYSVRNRGLEVPELVRKRGVNDFKLAENLRRAKSVIFEYAFCNEWQYFITMTLDPRKYDRTNLEKWRKDFTHWLRNYSRKGAYIQYLLVPELHSDGKSWHMHGFIKGLPVSELSQFKVGDKMGKAIADKVLQGATIFNWPAYQEKFGFCDLEPIRNSEAVSKYITKYVNKQVEDSIQDLGAHTFYASKGLEKAVLIKKGTMSWEDIVPTYENEYCKTFWGDCDEQTLANILDSFIDDV